MKTIRKRLSAALPAALLTMGACSLHCFAEGSVEDVYAAMRRIGLPESMVQEAKTQYQNTPHDDAGMQINDNYFTYDVWADMIELYEDDIWDEVGKQFNVSGTDIREEMKATETAAPETPDEPEQTQTTAAPVTVDGKLFINMTLQEKQDYVASLPEDQRAAFLASLSNSERNSIIKQMAPDSQANVMSGFIGLGEQLGMHISVDQLDGNGISYAVRNSDGDLIDSNSVSAGADDTGWNKTVPVLGSSAVILLAAGGLLLLAKRSRREAYSDETV